VIHPAHHPRTRARLESEGLRVEPIEMDELAKAEAGVTCCCLLVRLTPI
jgi:N-dimethylarginine dimethylaminohydrolase